MCIRCKSIHKTAVSQGWDPPSLWGELPISQLTFKWVAIKLDRIFSVFSFNFMSSYSNMDIKEDLYFFFYFILLKDGKRFSVSGFPRLLVKCTEWERSLDCESGCSMEK